jgi:hypothetical protein
MEAAIESAADRTAYVREVAEILVRKHGKKKYYTPAQVKKASAQSRFDVDWHCWAMCVFSSGPDFSDDHQSVGENCDYAAMKTEMTSLLTDEKSDSWFDIDLSWLDWPDIELPSIFWTEHRRPAQSADPLYGT